VAWVSFLERPSFRVIVLVLGQHSPNTDGSGKDSIHFIKYVVLELIFILGGIPLITLIIRGYQ
jgi:hypothetical protein